jgi:hypothetical protein
MSWSDIYEISRSKMAAAILLSRSSLARAELAVEIEVLTNNEDTSNMRQILATADAMCARRAINKALSDCSRR